MAVPPAVFESADWGFIQRVTLRKKLLGHMVLTAGERITATCHICRGKHVLSGGCECKLTLYHSCRTSSLPTGCAVRPYSSPCPPPLRQRQLSPPPLSVDTLHLHKGQVFTTTSTSSIGSDRVHWCGFNFLLCIHNGVKLNVQLKYSNTLTWWMVTLLV